MIEKFLSADARNLRPSAIRALAKYINDPKVISFAGGSPNPETFPAERFAVIADRVLRERRNVSLQYGPTRGLPRLCEFVAARSRVKSEEVILTTGSQQALDLISHCLLDAGDIVAVELPTYIGGTSAFYARSATLAGVAQDDDGIVPESLDDVARKKRIKLLYTIPNFQNPSGRLMSQRRRDRVLEIANRHDFLIVEDDPYGDLVKCAPYAVNVQIKVEVEPRGQPKQAADLARVVKILRAANYQGYVTLEYEASEDPRQAIPRHLMRLRELLG